MTPAQIQRHIAKLESRLDGLRAQARIVEGELLLYRAELHLRTDVVSTTLSTQMEAPTAISPHRKTHEAKAAIAKGRNRHGAHPFVAAVLNDPRFGSVTAWAAAKKLPLATAASWYATGGAKVMRKSGRRPIPRMWAERIEEEFRDRKSGKSLVPADEATWANGISE